VCKRVIRVYRATLIDRTRVYTPTSHEKRSHSGRQLAYKTGREHPQQASVKTGPWQIEATQAN